MQAKRVFSDRVKLMSLVVLIGLTACKNKTLQDAPIPISNMAKILADMHLAESYSLGLGDSARNKFDKNYDSLTVFYHTVLNHYKLSINQFDDALNWYKSKPVFMDSLYQCIELRMDDLRKDYKLDELKQAAEIDNPKPADTLNAIEATKAKPTDSIKKSKLLKPFTSGSEK